MKLSSLIKEIREVNQLYKYVNEDKDSGIEKFKDPSLGTTIKFTPDPKVGEKKPTPTGYKVLRRYNPETGQEWWDYFDSTEYTLSEDLKKLDKTLKKIAEENPKDQELVEAFKSYRKFKNEILKHLKVNYPIK